MSASREVTYDFESLSRYALGQALRQTRNTHDAEDLAQDALQKLVSHVPAKAKGWLKAVIRNASRKAWRKASRISFEALNEGAFEDPAFRPYVKL